MAAFGDDIGLGGIAPSSETEKIVDAKQLYEVCLKDLQIFEGILAKYEVKAVLGSWSHLSISGRALIAAMCNFAGRLPVIRDSAARKLIVLNEDETALFHGESIIYYRNYFTHDCLKDLDKTVEEKFQQLLIYCEKKLKDIRALIQKLHANPKLESTKLIKIIKSGGVWQKEGAQIELEENGEVRCLEGALREARAIDAILEAYGVQRNSPLNKFLGKIDLQATHALQNCIVNLYQFYIDYKDFFHKINGKTGLKKVLKTYTHLLRGKEGCSAAEKKEYENFFKEMSDYIEIRKSAEEHTAGKLKKQPSTASALMLLDKAKIFRRELAHLSEGVHLVPSVLARAVNTDFIPYLMEKLTQHKATTSQLRAIMIKLDPSNAETANFRHHFIVDRLLGREEPSVGLEASSSSTSSSSGAATARSNVASSDAAAASSGSLDRPSGALLQAFPAAERAGTADEAGAEVSDAQQEEEEGPEHTTRGSRSKKRQKRGG